LKPTSQPATEKCAALTIPAAFQPLARSFYEPSADKVAPLLIGHWLVRRARGGLCGGVIVEAEAYLADDPACHAFTGETARNRSMFGPPGRAYVYFIYGNHWCFNAVCARPGVGEAVLVRALEPAFGLELLRVRRPVATPHELTDGPAKLCQALAVDRQLDGVDLCDADSPVFIAVNAQRAAWLRRWGPVVRARRVGLTKAAHLLLRFYAANNPWVSRR
jgi:DNA-3-methyladenine glycosylase